MDSADDTRGRPEPSRFREAVFQNSASSPVSVLRVVIPEFSPDQPFGDPGGVVWSPMGGAFPVAGDRALVAESDDGSWWVLAWWSGAQSGGGAVDARLAALETAAPADLKVGTYTTPTRAFNVNYQPNVTRPTLVVASVLILVPNAEAEVIAYCDNTITPTTQLQRVGLRDVTAVDSAYGVFPLTFIVPVAHYYRLATSTTSGSPTYSILTWREMTL